MSYFLGGLIPSLIKPVMKRRGFLSPRILLEWEKIVGPEFSCQCCPDRIIFPQGQKAQGTLYLIVDPRSAFRFEYIKDLILEKINTYFGYGAISHIKIFQKPLGLKEALHTSISSQDTVAPPLFTSSGHERLDIALQKYGASLAGTLKANKKEEKE